MIDSIRDTEFPGNNYLEKVPCLEAKLRFDPITYKHSVNVAHLCMRLSGYSNYNFDKDLSYYAGLFHDIGKTEIETDILQKSSKLTDEEFDKMKDHTTLGYHILLKHHFPTDVLLAAHLHHEKYDGTGYPFGLAGDEIPVIARILSICDVFDALTSDRPYRKAYPSQKALQLMSDSREHFDPELLFLFISNFEGYRVD